MSKSNSVVALLFSKLTCNSIVICQCLQKIKLRHFVSVLLEQILLAIVFSPNLGICGIVRISWIFNIFELKNTTPQHSFGAQTKNCYRVVFFFFLEPQDTTLEHCFGADIKTRVVVFEHPPTIKSQHLQ